MYRPIKNDISFLFPKEQVKKQRIPLTPKKIEMRERQFETLVESQRRR
jgi:hypothetical protein